MGVHYTTIRKIIKASKRNGSLKLPAHRAGLPGKERTRHACAPKPLRKGIIPHPNLLPEEERDYSPSPQSSPLKGEDD
jgi:hypothetical protein